MFTYALIYNLIIAVIFYDTVICQLIFFDDSDDSHNFTKCGDSTLVSTIHPLISNGTVSQIGNFPWHAGLYFRKERDKESWEQKCGGSLITDQFVLTAAHCVYKTNERDVRVAVGKIYRTWDRQEYGQQKRNVSNIIYPRDFQEDTFLFDIALLLLEEKIRLGKLVMPVCRGLLDGSKYFHNKKLFVAGWGQTNNNRNGSSSEMLLYNDVSYLPKNRCREFVPIGYSMFEKFCTIKNNNTDVSVVQRGDSGGGLTAVHDGLHYIYGIVSVKITTYYNSEMTLFTNITWENHISWIEREVGKYQSGFKWSVKELTTDRTTVNEVSPTIITTPELREYVTTEKIVGLLPTITTETESTRDITTVNEVPPTLITATEQTTDVMILKEIPPTIITGEELTPKRTTITSNRRLYSGCVLPSSPPERRYCSQVEGCREYCNFYYNECLLSPGTAVTSVKVVCAPGYIFPEQFTYPIATCKDDMWIPSIPECISCGVFNKGLTHTALGGQKEKVGFPWHAGVYYRTEKDGKIVWEQKCSGIVISFHIVLTGATCINTVKYVTDIRVAVGKYHRSWDAKELTEQKRNVSWAYYPPKYSSGTTAYDIAVIVLEKRLKFDKNVLFVCQDLNANDVLYTNSNLYVSSWGRSIDGNTSDVLLYNKVTVLGYDACRRAVPASHNIYQAICIVKDNNSDSILQTDDTGSALTTIYQNGLHYLVGVFSKRFNEVYLFTNVKTENHKDWIMRQINIFF